jgi:ammonia channel protein AmtB
MDTGDTTWDLISAALVMIMTPGAGFFYAGLLLSKNALANAGVVGLNIVHVTARGVQNRNLTVTTTNGT